MYPQACQLSCDMIYFGAEVILRPGSDLLYFIFRKDPLFTKRV